MIHTQYYALLRGLSEFINQNVILPIQQWDYNYNSIVIEQLKKYGDIKPYPKGRIDIVSVDKQPNLMSHNYEPDMYAYPLIEDIKSRPLAQVKDKFALYGMFNWYTISVNIAITFETNAQMLDVYHTILENIPKGFQFYGFEYSYYIKLDHTISNMIDPYEDEVENIFVNQLKDDASNFQFYTLASSAPITRMDSINLIQDTKSQLHQLQLSFTIRDQFIYELLVIDMKYFLRAWQLNFIIAVELDNGDTEEIMSASWREDTPLEYKDEPSTADIYQNVAKGTNNDTERDIYDTRFLDESRAVPNGTNTTEENTKSNHTE